MTQSNRKLYLGPLTRLRCHHLEGKGSRKGPNALQAAVSDLALNLAEAMGIPPEQGEQRTAQTSLL